MPIAIACFNKVWTNVFIFSKAQDSFFEAIENAQDITENMENPFKELSFFSFLTLVFFNAKPEKAKVFI